MIICCYTVLNQMWNSDELELHLAHIPPALKQQIMLKKNARDIQLSVCGNLLLLNLLKRFDLDSSLSLTDMVYNSYHRPFFNEGFDFNIAHSGNMVVCCGTDKGKVGIDTELIKPINFDDYTDYFTATEWNNILNNEAPDIAFFKYWTRKEAILKAAGTGFYTELKAIDVTADSILYEDRTYFLADTGINPLYQSCIASSIKQKIILQQVIFP